MSRHICASVHNGCRPRCAPDTTGRRSHRLSTSCANEWASATSMSIGTCPRATKVSMGGHRCGRLAASIDCLPCTCAERGVASVGNPSRELLTDWAHTVSSVAPVRCPFFFKREREDPGCMDYMFHDSFRDLASLQPALLVQEQASTRLAAFLWIFGHPDDTNRT